MFLVQYEKILYPTSSLQLDPVWVSETSFSNLHLSHKSKTICVKGGNFMPDDASEAAVSSSRLVLLLKLTQVSFQAVL